MTKKIFKTLFALLLCTLVMALIPTAATQAKTKNKNTGKIGKNATWTYNEKKKVLTISGKGSVKANDLRQEDKKGDWLWLGREEGNVPMFEKIVFKEGITKIDFNFFCMENVESISLPKSFKSILYYSRGGSMGSGVNGQLDPWSSTLKKITVHKKNKTFKSSKGVLLSKNGKKLYVFPSGKTVDSYKLPNKVTRIEKYAFWGADIRKVTIGNKVTRIEEYAFYNSALKEVTFGKSVERIGRAAFQECVISQLKFPESLTYIAPYAFSECPITELTIPSKVTKIEAYAFRKNHKLKKIVLQGSTEIHSSAFANTVNYYGNDENNIYGHNELPITVVLGKKMKANVTTLCASLGSNITFQVEAGNTKYYVKDGNLYTIRGDKLVYERKKEEAKPETPKTPTPEKPATPSADTATGGAVQI